MDKHLHIVCLDVPLPADYGGAIDIFYKIKALHQIGIKLHVHCFTKGRKPVAELQQYCESLYYYPRKKIAGLLNPGLPYIVSSRSSKALLTQLNKDRFPILLEGIHCSYFLQKGALINRKIFLRMHNAEFVYYKHLARHEKNLFKKLYFQIESIRLKKYEAGLPKETIFLAISKTDEEIYQQHFSIKNIKLLPAFTPWQQVNILPGMGNYALYHGNLAINENEAAVHILLQQNVGTAALPLCIAGKNPTAHLIKKIAQYPQVKLISNPSPSDLQELIHGAQINILPAVNATGIKLKLLHALFNGRHCVVNEAAVAGSGLAPLCRVVSAEKDFASVIKKLSTQVFSETEINTRIAVLNQSFNNITHAHLLSSWL